MLDTLLRLWEMPDFRVGHSQSFDARIIRIATKRFRDEALQERWKDGQAQCTGWIGKKAMNLKKMPTLAELYAFLFKEELVGAHDAKVDMEACRRCWFKLRSGAE